MGEAVSGYGISGVFVMKQAVDQPFRLSFGTIAARVVSLLASSIDRIPRVEIRGASIAPISPFFSSTIRAFAPRGISVAPMTTCAAAFGALLCVVGCMAPAEKNREALVGPVWVAEDIGGRGVIDFLQSSIAFTETGEVTGSGGCNAFRGRYTRDGSALTIGPLAGTRKACPPAVMNQEAAFHEALGRVRGYRFANGLLYLLDAGGEPVIRLWQRK